MKMRGRIRTTYFFKNISEINKKKANLYLTFIQFYRLTDKEPKLHGISGLLYQ